MLEVIYVIGIYKSEKWNNIRTNAMNSKFKWSDSAKKYIAIYNNLINW